MKSMQIKPDTMNPFIWTQSPVSRLVLNCFCCREMYQLIGSLSNNDGDGNEDGTGREKSNRFRWAKWRLCTCITIFCTFLCRRCTTTTWKRLNSRFVEDAEHKKTTFFFFSKNFDTVFWRIKRDGISAMKFEATRIHFLSDVFVAVAVVVA